MTADIPPACERCAFADMDPSDDESGVLLRCHRYPPLLFVLDGEVCQSFPDMGASEWCGEYRPDTRGLNR